VKLGETLLNFVFSMWIRMIMHWVSRGVCGDGGWPEKTGFECVYQRKCGSKASGGFLGIGQNISKPSDSMNVAWTLKAPFFLTRTPEYQGFGSRAIFIPKDCRCCLHWNGKLWLTVTVQRPFLFGESAIDSSPWHYYHNINTISHHRITTLDTSPSS
jgi:hypothetical protein